MPNCFQLLRDNRAVPLNDIDEEMCRHFKAPCDPDRYFEDWYILIGYDLASGDSLAEIKTRYADNPVLVQIVDWLAENFTPRAWYELKSHPKAR
jgi:hypothetical protein